MRLEPGLSAVRIVPCVALFVVLSFFRQRFYATDVLYATTLFKIDKTGKQLLWCSI